MRRIIFLTLLILGILVSGCVGKQQDEAPSTAAEETVDETLEEMPDVGEVSEDELTPEPDLEINDTVDLGSLL